MKKILFEVSQETLQIIRHLDDVRRRKGRVWVELSPNGKRQLRLELYQHTPKRTMRRLYRSPFGWLADTAHYVRLTLNVPKDLGWHRCANLLLGDAQESADALHQMADTKIIDEPTDFQGDE